MCTAGSTHNMVSGQSDKALGSVTSGSCLFTQCKQTIQSLLFLVLLFASLALLFSFCLSYSNF